MATATTCSRRCEPHWTGSTTPEHTRLRFVGEIAGAGSTSGTRLVVGSWSESPYGPFVDVMAEDPAGRRTLLAPTDEIGDFVASTYRFDDVQVSAVHLASDAHCWRLRAGPLTLRLDLGPRPPLGRLLRLLPRRLTGAVWWAAAVDPVARLLLPGVRTRGSAGDGRREWYGAHDQHRVVGLSGSWHGVSLGALAPVDPPVRFGFGSTPRAPAVVRVTTTVRP